MAKSTKNFHKTGFGWWREKGAINHWKVKTQKIAKNL